MNRQPNGRRPVFSACFHSLPRLGGANPRRARRLNSYDGGIIKVDSLLGITTGDWYKLLLENRFAVAPAYWGRAAVLTALSFWNSARRRKEERAYGAEVVNTEIKVPLLIVGHWRSGTTLLHNLLELDEQFAYPNLFQVTHPHTFLCGEPVVSKVLANTAPQKRPMNNMKVTFASPGEDEFAISMMSLRSPIISWSFPRRQDYYDRYLTFRGVLEEDIARWKAAFVWFLKKLTWRYGRPLLLKSPAHTARIRLILELFPDARFVHIHRHPYTIFQSTQWLYEKAVSFSYLQRPETEQINAGILRRYAEMYDAFLEERALIPAGQFHEVSFQELEQDMVGQVGRLYESLNLDGFRDLEPKLRRYVEAIAAYEKNVYPPLAEPLRRRVAQAWRRSFDEWSYAI